MIYMSANATRNKSISLLLLLGSTMSITHTPGPLPLSHSFFAFLAMNMPLSSSLARATTGSSCSSHSVCPGTCALFTSLGILGNLTLDGLMVCVPPLAPGTTTRNPFCARIEQSSMNRLAKCAHLSSSNYPEEIAHSARDMIPGIRMAQLVAEPAIQCHYTIARH